MLADHQAIGQRFAHALNTRDAAALASAVTEDFVSEWPQSRERIRGAANYFRMLVEYPGAQDPAVGTDESTIQTHAPATVKVVAPTFTLVSVEGGGDTGTLTCRVRYPDGAWWWAVNLYRLRQGRIAKLITYFAPEYPAPEWRAQWVVPIPSGAVGP